MGENLSDKLRNIRKNRDVSFFDLYSVEQLRTEDIALILEIAREFRKHKTAKLDLCKGKSMVNAFFEASTRTLSSFDLAGKNLSMDTTSLSGFSSVSKGESMIDTIQTLNAYQVATIVVRAKQSGIPFALAKYINANVISAGDGKNEHPTQALLDALTMLDHFGGENLAGKIITIIGDVKHSRVFGSLVRILKKLKIAEIRVAAPETFFPEAVENFGVKKFYSVDKALEKSDIVYVLRVQNERNAESFIPSLREYSKTFGLTEERMKLTAENSIIMHPGPVIRDIEISSALVTRSEKSKILQQVENGMAIRKALLWLLSDRCDGRKKTYQAI